MGSKQRLLPWIHGILAPLSFETALDAFSGSGAVSYLLKCMGKTVCSNDFLRIGATLAEALVVQGRPYLPDADAFERLVALESDAAGFIESTFSGIFFSPEDLRFLDSIWTRLPDLAAGERALVLAGLARACFKRQPRGVFTVAGDPEQHKDGRRDLRLSLREHLSESLQLFESLCFEDGRPHRARFGDVFELEGSTFDLVYLDPPYVPRSDDNCYVKRYHFIEGLMSNWRAPEIAIMEQSKVKKLEKRYTPFSYRRSAEEAFERLFGAFPGATLALSYSSNGWPDLQRLVELMRRQRPRIEVHEKEHRYSFGTHATTSPERRLVREYLIVGQVS